ncbi:MAG: hypothetical protein IPP77_07315 [Bacteroidetes bacterium]|nr:hypothetical protein [Bacteroidota bacterium]
MADTAWACGNNGDGQLGDGSSTSQSSPVQVISLLRITSIATGGGWFFSFLKNDSTVWACGKNDYGQLGNGSTTNFQSPWS